jgi:predicted house-cleaning noncanonical NTP pyrophosphatase (MazG superfamily)
MASRAQPPRRVPRPLSPIIPVLTVVGDAVVELAPASVTPQAVGLKAVGLASLPVAWTQPFFVVTHGSLPERPALVSAIGKLGLRTDAKLIVRSSGTDESMESRGALESAECDIDSLAAKVEQLRSAVGAGDSQKGLRVHWVVQQLLPTMAKGHLSNERRIAEEKRDWVAEVEASAGHAVEFHPIPLRTWRDSRPALEDEILSCQYRESYLQCLTVVARWAYERLIRVHFEWVWDGHAIYLVQADGCDDTAGGVDPKDLVQLPPKRRISGSSLRLFREASAADYQDYRKLANVRLYRELGYEMVPFYVLDDQVELKRLVEEGRCSDDLKADLEVLAARPLVIRCDGRNVPAELRQMLPRSEELRTGAEAEHWLLGKFRTDATTRTTGTGTSLAECTPCLIAHHFMPATASAWCQARPDHRRVRIESLWGLPEGLYWYAYDAFDVDTQVTFVERDVQRPNHMPIRERRRYKEHFVAPDSNGNWVLHKSAAGPDWQRSIKRSEWVEEIAWASRRIAAAVGYPVVVMWFVDVPKAVSNHRVLPWYHEPWKTDASPHKAAPRRKLSATTDFVLRGKADWAQLKSKVESGEQIVRVRVDPSEPEIVRDREFAEELAAFAKQHKLVVELAGGVLSHAYYMLARAGCTVECADLDDYATADYEVEFNKLVRDLIPAAIAARGEAVTALRLEGAALMAALRRKLVEESLEVLDAETTEQIAEELADVREVVLAIMSRLGITETDVEARRKRKVKARGAFAEALMLSKTSVAPSMGFRELQDDEGGSPSLVAATIDREAEIPGGFEDIHLDRRVDASGAAERQFTIDVPAHAAGYQSSRVPFGLPTQSGEQHEMVFELVLGRKGSDLRVRVRLMNAQIQLGLDFGDGAASNQARQDGK